MARHEPNIRASTRTELEVEELLTLLRDSSGGGDRERQEAIACYLSGSEGWDDAVQRLGGAFAERNRVKGT